MPGNSKYRGQPLDYSIRGGSVDTSGVSSEPKYAKNLNKVEGQAVRGLDDREFIKKFNVDYGARAGKVSLENEEAIRRMKLARAAQGSVASALLNVFLAGQVGWGAGRVLGQAPLLTDRQTTYDQFYQNAFSGLFR